MANVKVVMNSAGIEAVLSSPGVTADLERRASAIKRRADSMGSATYEVHTRPGRKGGRPYVVVAANSPHAIASNAKHNSLAKSISAGRG